MPTSARRFENRAVRLYEAFPPIRFRGDVGIAPQSVDKPQFCVKQNWGLF